MAAVSATDREHLIAITYHLKIPHFKNNREASKQKNKGKKHCSQMRKFIQKNFSTFAVGSLTASMFAGWMCLDYIQNQQKEKYASLQQPASVLDDKSSRKKSREELRLQAMVENALQSSWKENLDNAYAAQERFMLPGREHGKDPNFVRKIDRRVNELMKKQKKKEGKKEGSEDEGGENEKGPSEMKDANKIQFWK